MFFAVADELRLGYLCIVVHVCDRHGRLGRGSGRLLENGERGFQAHRRRSTGIAQDLSNGADGFVSLEVSPTLANDTQGTIAEAKRLWKEVDRPNVMIKVPATPEGLPAIEQLLGAGINVNITLMFSQQHYEDVAQAYIRGLTAAAHPEKIGSVASFFVSRLDTMIDPQLDKIGTPEALALRGKAAIANCRVVYKRFQELFYGDAFAALRKKGARVQRVLWASTSAKNPAYRDVVYVEELIGPDTVNTMPPATVDAFRDHGEATPDS